MHYPIPNHAFLLSASRARAARPAEVPAARIVALPAARVDAPSLPRPAVAPAVAFPGGDPRNPTVFDLSRGEQLLVWSARRWRYGRFRWSQVEREFARCLGAGWQDALVAWDAVLDLLHLNPTGLPDIPNGNACHVSADELRLLTVVALFQSAGVASPDLMLSRLGRPTERASIRAHLADLARALKRCPLPVRAG